MGRISTEAYRENLERATHFLNGNYESVMEWLEQEMWKAADVLDFESATRYRDRLEATKRIATRYRLVLPNLEDVDFIEGVLGDSLGVVVVLRVRRGRLVGSESFVVDSGPRDKMTLIKGFIEDFYLSHFSLPPRACVSLDEVAFFNRLKADLGVEMVLAPPAGPFEAEIMAVALENAQKNLIIEEEKDRKKAMCRRKCWRN